MAWLDLQNRTNAAALAVFGGAVTFAGAGAPVTAVFNEAYALGSVGAVGMASSMPSLVLQSSAVPANPVGQLVAVGAISYMVAAAEPDGLGMTCLLLEVAA